MAEPRFLQVHTVCAYTAALLNRDDSGLAKRLPYGEALRTRISSQCLKRHWRTATTPHSLGMIDGAQAAYRSRELVTRRVFGPLRERFPADVIDVLEPQFQMAVYGDKGTDRKTRQTLLFGDPEIKWLADEAERLALDARGSANSAKGAVAEWRKAFHGNIKAMRESSTLPAGLASALFGRMVTSDPKANIAAPVHVAHAFTVHAEEQESDYFTAVDDLAEDETGADTIQETELTSGLYYGYVVVDLPGLLLNLGGDTDLAGRVLHNLVYLIAETSPGAKLGSTAPYGRAAFVLLEAGDRPPRSLAEAYREPCKPFVANAIAALSDQLASLDRVYATGEDRLAMSLMEVKIPGASLGSLADLAAWAQSMPGRIAS